MEVVNYAIDKAWNGLYALPNKKPQPAAPVMNNFKGFEK